jgi:hypothetical protein
MFSNSKSSTLNANASDGGILTFGGGIAPLTLNRGVSPTMLLVAAGAAVVLLVGLVLFLRK